MKKLLENIGLMMVIFFLVAAMIPAGFAEGDDNQEEHRLYTELPDLVIEGAEIGDFNEDGVCDGLRVYYKNDGHKSFQIDDDGFMASVVINDLYSSGYAGVYTKEIDLPAELESIAPGQKFHDTIPYDALLKHGFRSGEENSILVRVDTRDDIEELNEDNNKELFFLDDNDCTDHDYDEREDDNEDYNEPENHGFVKEEVECPASGVLELHDRKELLVHTDDGVKSVFLKFWEKPGIVYVNGDRIKLEHGEVEKESLGHGMKIYLKENDGIVRYEIMCGDQGNDNDDDYGKEDEHDDVNTCTVAHSLFLNEGYKFALGENEVKVEVLEIDDDVAVFRVNGKLLDVQVGQGKDFENGMIWLKGVGKKPNGLYAVFLLECTEDKYEEENEQEDKQDEQRDENKPEDKPEQQLPHKDEVCEDGCKKEDMCLGIGLRLISDESPVYCDLDGELKHQKGEDVSCQNNYECESNTCQSGACVDLQEQLKRQMGMLERILMWFEKIFG